jgi:hypothetical protein
MYKTGSDLKVSVAPAKRLFCNTFASPDSSPDAAFDIMIYIHNKIRKNYLLSFAGVNKKV